MPIYTYTCNSCFEKFELFFSFSSYNEHPKCLLCESKNTQRSYGDDLCMTFVKKSDSELKTIGDLANRNRDKMSQDEKIELSNKHNKYKEQHSNKELPTGMSRMKKTNIKNKWY